MYEYKRSPSKLKTVILLVLLIIAVAAISIFLYDIYINIDVNNYSETSSASRLSQTEQMDKEQEQDITEVLEGTVKCVVGISKIKNAGSSIFTKNSTTELGLGTGIIVSDNGHILTNWHLVGNKYGTCYITLENGTTHNGNVVWADGNLDLAIVKINANGLTHITLGDSDNIKIGEQVYAIGNPIGFEFQRTVTAGIISGVDRTIKIQENNEEVYMSNLIQTDATINPGNSGGPLINEYGEMIGINSVKISDAEGIGFAMPINLIKSVIESFVNNGNFEEAYLGIFAYDKEVIPYLDSNIEFNSGIYVTQISKDGPCYLSSLKIGDVITKIDDYEINTMSGLRRYIYTKKPHDVVALTVVRNNKEYSLEIKLGKK